MLSAAAPSVAAVTPDVGDTRASAQPVAALAEGTSGLVDRPGDRDWFSVAGRNADASVNAVFVRVLRVTAGCTALDVELINTEGRWMRTARATAQDVATVLPPANPSPYYVLVRAVEPGCSGLEYEVTSVATEPTPPGSAASPCLVARSKRIAAQDRLDDLRGRRRTLSLAAQRRYDGYIASTRRTLRRARASEKRICR